MVRIKEAIINYNRNLIPGQKKMTQAKIAQHTIKEGSLNYKQNVIHYWSIGERLNTMTPAHIKRMANLLNVTEDYLLGK